MSIYYTVYLTTNLVTSKIYVGAHKTENLNDGYLGSGTSFKHALKKYGKDNFSHVVLFVFDNEHDMYEMEARIVDVDFVRRQDNYNGIPGGMGGKGMSADMHPLFGKTHSDEAKARMSKAKKGDAHFNYGKRGEGMPMFGKTHSDETKEVLRQKSVGNQHSKGHKHSDESKLKMSISRTGKTRAPTSDEAKQKMRDTYNRTQSVLTCPHCAHESRNKANMNKYHFDACKYKESINIFEV